MALQVFFGNGATATQSKLDSGSIGYAGDDVALNGGSVSETSASGGSVGGVIETEFKDVSTVKVPDGASGTGGTVTISFDVNDNAFSFQSNAWNAVKNAKAVSSTAENVTFTDFVHVDVDFSAAKAASSVTIQDVKRANVSTGNGADTIAITLATNSSGYQNTVNVSSGSGSDTITIGAGTKSGNAGILDGRFTTATIDAGAGNDTIDLSGVRLASATITGGTGNDTMTGSRGVDTYVYNAVGTKGGSGSDIITNFQVSQDKFALNGVSVTAHGDDIDGNLQIGLNDGTKIVLQGVKDAQYGSILFA